MAVLEAYEPIERRWHDRVSGLDVAVDEIPRIAPKDPDSVQWPPEVIADGPIALARLIPAGVDIRGNSTRARVVLFRKPIERRAKDTDELADLLHEVFSKFKKVVTVEDGCLMGGFGSAVLEWMVDQGYQAQVKRLGIPDDIIEHGEQIELHRECGFDPEGIAATVRSLAEHVHVS